MNRLFNSSRRGRPAKSKKRRAIVQHLERRKLLAADGFDVPISNDSAAEVSTMNHDGSNQTPIMFKRIVNGTQTNQHESVGIVNNQCSGTLIAPNAVLTAAHCVGGVGETFEVGGRTYQVQQTVVHPDYQSRDIDLAVMILSEDVVGVTPSEINRTDPQIGQMLTLVGFGATGTPTAGHDGSFGVKHVGQTPIDKLTNDTVEWTYDNASESNTAPGDSGGPAFIEINGKLVIAGVTSGGSKDDASLGDQSYDVRVDTYASWIDNVVNGNITGGGDTVGGGETGGDTVGGEIGDENDPIVEDLGSLSAEQLAQDELEYLDTNGDGLVSRDEIVSGYSDGPNDPTINEFADQLISDYDTSGDGSLDLPELVASYQIDDLDAGDVHDPVDQDPVDEQSPSDPIDDSTGGEMTAQQLAQNELDEFDGNGDGVLDRDELIAEVVSYGASQTEAQEETDWLLNDYDHNQDGALDLDELTASWAGEVGDETDSDLPWDDGAHGDSDWNDSGQSDDFGESLDDGGLIDDGGLLDDGMFEEDLFGNDMMNDEMFDDGFDPHYGCDINSDGSISPMDALLLVNQLGSNDPMDFGDFSFDIFDVNDDGNFSPMDVLSVINRLSAQERARNAATSDVLLSQHHRDANEPVDILFASLGQLN